jgi:hypothetical protein
MAIEDVRDGAPKRGHWAAQMNRRTCMLVGCVASVAIAATLALTAPVRANAIADAEIGIFSAILARSDGSVHRAVVQATPLRFRCPTASQSSWFIGPGATNVERSCESCETPCNRTRRMKTRLHQTANASGREPDDMRLAWLSSVANTPADEMRTTIRAQYSANSRHTPQAGGTRIARRTFSVS